MKQWKRVVKVALSVVLAMSMVIGSMTTPVSAAKAKKATLKTKKVSVQVGKTKTIQLKNKKKSCKYTFKSSKKKIATVSSKGKIKGKKTGKATITVKEVAKKGKGKSRKVGTVKVTVTKKKKTTTATTVNNSTGGGNNAGNNDTTVTPAPVIPQVGTAVKVYMDEIKDENLIAEVDGVGIVPTPVPEATVAPEATPEPTPVTLVNATMEDGETDPIKKRGDANVSLAEGGANNTSKSLKVAGRSADWHGANIDVTSMVETGKNYEITFYAKQTTGKDYKIELAMQYVDDEKPHYDGIQKFDLKNNTWTLCQATMTVPEHVGDISIYWQSEYNSNNFMDFYLDEVTMKGVAKVAGSEPDTPDLSTGLVKGRVGNPIMTSRLTADPWAMEYNGRIYVYGTNDSQQYNEAPNADNNYAKIKTLNCYSSADMVNWTDHGTIAVSGSKGAAKWSANSWAPAVAHKKIDGKDKFFLYFANNASSIGVLTADSPTGPWTDPIGKPLIDRSIEGCAESEIGWLFDPAVLVDDDGTGYLYFGGIGDTEGKTEEFIRNPKCARVVKLGDDMISVDGAAKTIDAPFMFEDSGINKIGDKYYYSYCTNWTSTVDGKNIDRSDCPTANIAVMVSDSPMGDFQYVGCVLKNPGTYFGATGNNHHCFAEFNGTLYAFYHTKKDTISAGTKQDYRTTYANVLNLGENGDFTNKDGSVADTKMTTSGVKSIGTVNPYGTVEAETFAMADTVGTMANAETNSVADWFTNYSIYNGKIGSYIGVANVDFGADGASEVAMKLSDVNSTGYKELTAKLSKKVTGQHTIYFVFGKEGVLMDSWSFKK